MSRAEGRDTSARGAANRTRTTCCAILNRAIDVTEASAWQPCSWHTRRENGWHVALAPTALGNCTFKHVSKSLPACAAAAGAPEMRAACVRGLPASRLWPAPPCRPPAHWPPMFEHAISPHRFRRPAADPAPAVAPKNQIYSFLVRLIDLLMFCGSCSPTPRSGRAKPARLGCRCSVWGRQRT